MVKNRLYTTKGILLTLVVGFCVAGSFITPQLAQANPSHAIVTSMVLPKTLAVTKCGDIGGPNNKGVVVSIDLGCKNKGNPIADATFAIIRIMSDGVGLVVVGSIIVGGMQYTGSRGDPQSTAKAIGRIRSSIFALLLYLFGYAILNYIIPGQFLK